MNVAQMRERCAARAALPLAPGYRLTGRRDESGNRLVEYENRDGVTRAIPLAIAQRDAAKYWRAGGGAS